MSIDAWFKPPLTVFVVWGCFVLCFLLCGSSKRLCGFLCCECDDDPIEYDEETYEHLSSRRRQELDNLRSIAVLRQLARFTLMLKQENMVRQLPDSDPQCLDYKGELDDTEADKDEGGGDHKASGDVEMGRLGNSTDPSTVIDNEYGIEGEYTHVLIPPPGHDVDGKHMLDILAEGQDSDGGKKRKSLKQKLFSRKSKEPQEAEENNGNEDKKDNKEERKEDDDRATDVDDAEAKEPDADLSTTEKRSVPIFCAVCLMEYAQNERVCWSSNYECTHVFHEDCILQWLVSLGRKRSGSRSFGRNPSDAKLLDYGMECPCCRQEFVSGHLVLMARSGVDEGEENV